ncbi:hypothetical protein ElyMa_002749300 [Elysia marginata]|uniref:Uncharacterized protein n=1 Tax=Elysia marginata TaxID=1093978 RepID=A0AAV4HH61_9GAST|nr:hypothetical protein ElyMa_002749300 [Elysia marginata]
MIQNFSLLVVAAVLSVAWATPCTDVCYGACDVASQGTTIFLPFFQAFVEPSHDTCRAICAAKCNCVDTCQSACGALLTTCRETPGFYYFVRCQFEYTRCATVCFTQCGMETTAGLLSRTMSVFLPPPEEA